MITIDTIRQLESAAPGFSERTQFARHVRKTIETLYEGVKTTDAGGLLRSDEADKIDRALQRLYREAGYKADDTYELACEIWSKKS